MILDTDPLPPVIRFPHPGPPADPRAPHQIVIECAPGGTHWLVLTCTCLKRARRPPAARRLRFAEGEALALYGEHLRAVRSHAP
jgi:hypothetical protein